VTDVKDLGSGVIGGVECNHLAFRTPDVDWQIWIAQGDRPYPCLYVITSPKVAGYPQYSAPATLTGVSGRPTNASATETRPCTLPALSPPAHRFGLFSRSSLGCPHNHEDVG
jgi:hypothetical protein